MDGPFSFLPLFTSVNAKQLEQPVFQAGPNRCESDHGRHLDLRFTNYDLRVQPATGASRKS
jgi:hypothetical protein